MTSLEIIDAKLNYIILQNWALSGSRDFKESAADAIRACELNPVSTKPNQFLRPKTPHPSVPDKYGRYGR